MPLVSARKRCRGVVSSVEQQQHHHPNHHLVAANDNGTSATFLLTRPTATGMKQKACCNRRDGKSWKQGTALSMAFIVLLGASFLTTTTSSSLLLPLAQAFEVRPAMFPRPWQSSSSQPKPIIPTFQSSARSRTFLWDTEVVEPTLVTAENLTQAALRVAVAAPSSSSLHQQQQSSASQQQPDVPDVPLPTENGGYSHTTASRAKISAANKGKTPWNKGRTRSPEERARIAAGVRAKNRERFLAKLAAMNVTEAEYEAQQAAAKAAKRAQVEARRTEKGGYRPTEETRQKISRILKEKHARGEVKRKAADPTKIRRGFTHSEETRRKISESLKKRWATDEEYRQTMMQKTNHVNKREDTRRKISESLRRKWQDPDFRDEMLQKMSNRTQGGPRDDEYREKISQAMKLKWQDEEYRKKTLASIAKRAVNPNRRPATSAKKKTRRPAAVKKVGPRVVAKRIAPAKVNGVTAPPKAIAPMTPKSNLRGDTAAVKPLRPLTAAPKQKTVTKKKKKVAKKKKTIKARTPDNGDEIATATATVGKAASKKDTEADGSVSRLFEERRDLYDLLYGDEEDASRVASTLSHATGSLSSLLANDDNLDAFDPYGLDDF